MQFRFISIDPIVTGTNLQALIDFSKNSGNNSSFEIVLVVSNCETAYGLKRAEIAGIPTAVSTYYIQGCIGFML